jgi:hypothetical protein
MPQQSELEPTRPSAGLDDLMQDRGELKDAFAATPPAGLGSCGALLIEVLIAV